MAEKEIERNEITFYLNDNNGNLRTKTTKIYSPYNIKTKGFETDEFNYIEPVSVTFDKWVYVLSLWEVWSEVVYDQIKEFLSFYNRKGGKLTKWIKEDWTYIKNWKTVTGNGFMNVTTEKKSDVTVKETIIEKEVKVQTIPRTVAEWMDFVQLEALAKAWGLTIPLDIKESGKTDEIKNRFIDLLSENLTD